MVQRVTAGDVAAALDRVRQAGMHPQPITVEHRTEFTWMALETWAFKHRVALDFARTRPAIHARADLPLAG